MSETRVIQVKVDTSGASGLKEVANQMKGINKNTKDTATSMSQLKNTFLGLAAAFGVGVGLKSLFEMSDSMQLLRDRTLAMSESAAEADAKIAGIMRVANDTKAPLNDMALAYNKLSIASDGTGLKSQGVLGVLQSLNQTFRISGADSEQAATSLGLLSRAFETGVLKGRELKAFMLSDPFLIKLLKKDMGDAWQAGLKDGIPLSQLVKTLSGHFQELNERADGMRLTFGQAATLIKNDLTTAVGELSEKLDISGKLVTGMNTLKENTVLVEALFLSVAVLTIPKLIAGIEVLYATITTFLVTNPVTVWFALLGLAIGIVINDLERFKNRWEQLKEVIPFVVNYILLGASKIAESFANIFGLSRVKLWASALANVFASEAAKASAKISQIQGVIEKRTASVADLKRGDDSNNTTLDWGKIVDPKKTKTFEQQLKEIEKQMGSLNTAFNKGGLDVEAYNQKLEALTEKKLSLELKEGKISLTKYREEMEKLNRTEIGNLFEHGKLTLNEYNAALKQIDLDAIRIKFDEGKVSALAYHEAVLKLSSDFEPGSTLYVGIQGYIESAGTLAQNVASNITGVFHHLEDSLLEFIKTGTFQFRKFFQAILDDINRLIIRALIVKPLANALLGGIGGLATPNTSGASGLGVNANGSSATEGGFANGGAFNKGVQFYAGGGIVNRTTSFGMANGKTAVMGEAGPEGIFPLSRGSDGKLGIRGSGSNVQVNIINQSGGEVQQTERQTPGGDKVIDILITGKVKEAFANGSMDKTMSQLYNVRRKGS